MQTQKGENLCLIAHSAIFIGTEKQIVFTMLMWNGNLYNKFDFINQIFWGTLNYQIPA